MSLLNTIITRKDGTSYDLNSMGIVTRDFVVSSPEYEHETHVLEGRNGQVTTGTRIKARTIRVLFYMRAIDNGDFALARDRVFALLHSKEDFYIADGRAIDRQWLVRQNGTFSMEQQGKYGFFEVEFVADMPYAKSKSIAGTQVHWYLDNGTWDSHELLWDQRMELMSVTGSGTIYNRGTVDIHPYEQSLTILITGASEPFVLYNAATGQSFSFYDTPTPDWRITLIGSHIHVNGRLRPEMMVGDFISLVTGANEISFSGGGAGATASFAFNYYYL